MYIKENLGYFQLEKKLFTSEGKKSNFKFYDSIHLFRLKRWVCIFRATLIAISTILHSEILNEDKCTFIFFCYRNYFFGLVLHNWCDTSSLRLHSILVIFQYLPLSVAVLFCNTNRCQYASEELIHNKCKNILNNKHTRATIFFI